MNYIDLILITPLVYFIVKGAIKGFFSQIFGLGGLVFGVYLAIQFYGIAAEELTHYLKTEYNDIIGFILIFIAVYLVFILIGKLLTKIFKTLSINIINRVLGLVLGAIKGLVLLIPLTMLFIYVQPYIEGQLNQAIADSIVISSLKPIIADYDLSFISL